MRWRLGLRSVGLLALLPLILLVAATLQTAQRARGAFHDMTVTLGAVAETNRLEGTIRRGLGRQLLAAMDYLRSGRDESWNEFTQLAWSVYEDEARYLGLPLTGDERLAVEEVRTRHRMFEGMAQVAMARRSELRAEDLRQLQSSYDQVGEAVEGVSRMIQQRLVSATTAAGQASSRLDLAVSILALLLAVAVAASATLALRGIVEPLEGLQRTAERLGRGDLCARAPTRGVPAVAQLSERFNVMAEELQGLLQRLEERVGERTAQLAALESVSQAGLAHLDRDALLRTVLEKMSAACYADAAVLRLVEGGTLVAASEPLLRQRLTKEPVGLGVLPLSRALETHRVAATEDPRGEWPTIVAVPLLVRDRVLGVAALLFRQARRLDADLVRLLEAIAARAALALERAEMVQEILRNAEELRSANQRLIETQQRLVEAERLAAVGQVHVALRHEINNPLSVLVGAAEILEHTESPDVIRRWTIHISEAASRISRVLQRLEDLRRVETTDYVAGVPMVNLGTDPKKD